MTSRGADSRPRTKDPAARFEALVAMRSICLGKRSVRIQPMNIDSIQPTNTVTSSKWSGGTPQWIGRNPSETL